MKCFASYNSATGEIKARYLYTDDRQIENYVDIIELTYEEYEMIPELTKKVDISHLKKTGKKRLIQK